MKELVLQVGRLQDQLDNNPQLLATVILVRMAVCHYPPMNEEEVLEKHNFMYKYWMGEGSINSRLRLSKKEEEMLSNGFEEIFRYCHK